MIFLRHVSLALTWGGYRGWHDSRGPNTYGDPGCCQSIYGRGLSHFLGDQSNTDCDHISRSREEAHECSFLNQAVVKWTLKLSLSSMEPTIN
jgi:hypothetical protein